ncbi:hypothetical protein G3480_23170 [Thiorhodococcus mannitoliphagus]|uniref:Schlafen AlbA-2 domain-containing protein n=1 Tax=Thiorhodococcus mannitoliphagus TaxID=329406 RepID=A0A6P1E3S4_9GAMM|nr:RNA-binding domain-containing protein [Thiorhodococcus mannitoliphagus]NEX23162.1 hypothetical protein [Thiorhodococcus mannitoliphagus]
MNKAEFYRTETDRIEWKRSPQDSDGILRATCALANDLGGSGEPGRLVIRLEKDGFRRGVDAQRLDQIQQDLSSRLRSTKIQPTPSFDISVDHGDDGVTLLVITVIPYPVPPMVMVDGVAWVRQGSSTRRATQADLLRLNERRPEHSQPFDLRPIAAATLQDLNLGLLRARYETERDEDLDEETFPGLEQWLTQRQLGRLITRIWRPNPAALLLFGVSPQSWLPGGHGRVCTLRGTGHR